MPDAGVVDDDVGHAVLGADLLGEPFDGLGVGDVEGVRVRDATARGDLRGGVLDTGLVDVADHQFGALAGELQRGRTTDAAARSGHGNQCVAEIFARDGRPARAAATGSRGLPSRKSTNSCTDRAIV